MSSRELRNGKTLRTPPPKANVAKSSVAEGKLIDVDDVNVQHNLNSDNVASSQNNEDNAVGVPPVEVAPQAIESVFSQMLQEFQVQLSHTIVAALTAQTNLLLADAANKSCQRNETALGALGAQQQQLVSANMSAAHSAAGFGALGAQQQQPVSANMFAEQGAAVLSQRNETSFPLTRNNVQFESPTATSSIITRSSAAQVASGLQTGPPSFNDCSARYLIQAGQASINTETNGGQSQLPTHSNVSYVGSQLNSASSMGYAKLYDLPTFSGNVIDWPMFERSFIDTTMEFGYSNTRNIIRLRNALEGEAKRVVAWLLPFPDCVQEIMAVLKENYGRPEQIINRQFEEVRKLPAMEMNDLGSVVAFANAIRNVTAIVKYVQADHRLSDATLMSEFVGKMPTDMKMQWAAYQESLGRYANMEDISSFLNVVAKRANMVRDEMPRQQAYGNKQLNNKMQKKHAFLSNTKTSTCIMCDKQCSKLVECNKFKAAAVTNRWQLVRERKLCFCCLRQGHNVSNCYAKKQCGVKGCEKQHHVLLHSNNESDQVRSNNNHSQVKNNENSTTVYNAEAESTTNKVWFQIVPVVLRANNKKVNTFAFIDHGSSHSMVDWDLMEELGVKGKKDTLNMQWLTNTRYEKATEVVSLELTGTDEWCKPARLAGLYTVRNMDLPIQSVHVKKRFGRGKFQQMCSVNYDNAQPKIVIGLDNAHLTRAIEKPIVVSNSGAIAAKTKLGWVVFGQSDETVSAANCFAGCSVRKHLQNLEVMMKEFYESDICSAPVKEPHISEQDRRVIDRMENSTKYIDGRFVVSLLWRSNDIILPPSREMALRRLEGIERKMRANDDFAQKYKIAINSFVQKGYARMLTDQETLKTSNKTFYLPHFAVVNPNKNKIRIVFDAAAEVGGCSLNKQLTAGPDLNQSLLSVLMKFREERVAICGDIREMFLQVRIAEDDQDSQRFLWRDGDATAEVKTYVMQSMLFGATCSPTLAQFVKNKNASHFEREFPRAALAIKERHYVDDYVDCFASEDEAITVIKAVKMIHKRAAFDIVNFVSNSPAVMNALGSLYNESSVVRLLEADVERVLGMFWNFEVDNFTFVLKFHRVNAQVLKKQRKPNKREVLSMVMAIYDPLGFLANIVITGKLIMQQLWVVGIGWDDPLPDDIYKDMSIWMNELEKVSQVGVPRWYAINTALGNLELHIFADASESAVAAVAYVRQVQKNGVVVRFLLGKTKCAPLKYTSIPRLELQAAVLAVRVKELVVKGHNVQFKRTYYWTDSMTVLSWIESDSRTYKQYVASRLSEILEHSHVNDWRWLPTSMNVADDATRKNLTFNPQNRWITGPKFLHELNDWPLQPAVVQTSEVQSELRGKKFCMISSKNDFIDFERFNNYSSLKRTVALVHRFVRKCNRKTSKEVLNYTEYLTADELKDAELFLCKLVQQNHFGAEYDNLKQGKPVRESSLVCLNPQLDEMGVMRVRGRLERASCLNMSEKRPIILPKDAALTRLIAEYYHVKMKHINRDTTICEIRRTFWIPAVRNLLKSVEAKCMFCKLRKAKPSTPMMGLLPPSRVEPFVRPFSYCGVDYFGPMLITVKRSKEKRWVALFTCLTTRAVHLELVNNLSSDACLLAIRNFINRRGVPKEIHSDNGTNFVGLKKELTDVQDFLDYGAVGAAVENLGIKWKFICPANPSQGGAWERLVQSVKKVLKIVLKECAPKAETLISVLTEAENIVNSRPLTHLPVTCEEDEPLTPNHFLLGCANSTQTPGPDGPNGICLRKQWRISQHLKNSFWHRWIREYLPELTRRTKWCQPTEALKEGDLVLVCETGAPRSEWSRGLIKRLHTGSDGIARSADVKTKQHTIKRPISKLAKIDIRPRSGEN